MGRSEYQGKRGANAGDEYHELWAVRRALELIVPGAKIVALTVEGVRAADEGSVDDALWDGVDATCYYGADPDHIDAVDLVQLKYSGSASASSWTVARLSYASNRNKTNSLINRLASAWKGIRETRPEIEIDRIRVRLVSNQPVAPAVSKSLSADPSDLERKKLREAAEMSEEDFSSFVPSLDFSGCGDASRFTLEDRVIAALSDLKDGDVRAELAQLREYIRKRMLPEAKGEPITAESVFGIFGHADPKIFYPCPSRILRVDNPIGRDVARRLANMLLRGTAKICLSGAGGEGKTTVLQELADRLPAGSELVVYDCYGEGTYLNANGYRHRSEDAFLQLANETAARLLLPPLLAERNADYPRKFAAKLFAAAQALHARNPEALLVIAIDAADNAVTAASLCTPVERAFVHDFVRLGELPTNVRLLVTAREGRLEQLDLPPDVGRDSIGPFSAAESREFAERRLGSQSDLWHEEFHRHSGGNPRVERYAIEFGGGNAEDALAYLKPNGKDLAAIFGARMAEARKKSGTAADLVRLCATLIALPRPVPLGHLAAIANLGEAHAHDLLRDLAPGLVLDGDGVGFADEDFEHFVMAEGKAAMPAVISTAAKHLVNVRTTDAYACAHVAALALRDGQRDLVIALLREPVREYPVTDPALRGEIHRRRLRAAMNVCRETGNSVDAAALLLEGALAIKTDDVIHRTLLEHIELAVRFSRDAIIGLILRDRDRRPAHGKLLLQLAAADGEQGDRVGLHSHLRSFMAWQEARADAIREEEQGEEGRSRGSGKSHRRYVGHSGHADGLWAIDADDIAALLSGQIDAEGSESAARQLSRPRPARFRYAVSRALVRRLARQGHYAELRSLNGHLPRRHIARPLISFALGLAGDDIDAAALLTRIERAGSAGAFDTRHLIYDYLPDDQNAEDLRSLLDTCDLVALHRGNRRKLATALRAAMPTDARTVSAMASYSPRSSDMAARAYALTQVLLGRSVDFDGFAVAIKVPKKKAGEARRREKTADELARERDKAKELFDPVLAFHAVRAEILLGKIAAADAANRLMKAAEAIGAARRHAYRDEEWRPRLEHAVAALLPLSAISGIDVAMLFSVIKLGLNVPQDLMGSFALTFLSRASVVPSFRTPIVTLAVRACDECRLRKIPADDKISHLAGLAKLLLPIDREAALYCFNATMETAGDVDYDTLQAIAIAAPLAARARLAGEPERAHAIGLKLAASAQDAAIRMGDSDYFPWARIGHALAAISPAIALAAVARFAELDIAPRQGFLDDVLERFAKDRTLDDSVLVAFLPLLGASGRALCEPLVDRAASEGNPAIAEEAARSILREPPHDWTGLAERFAKVRSPGRETSALVNTELFLRTKPVSSVFQEHSDRPDESITNKASNSALLDVAGIDGVASFLSRISAIIDAEALPIPSRREVAIRLLGNVPDHRISAFLDILSEIPEGDDIVFDIAHLFTELLARWHDKPAARRWSEANLLRLIESRLPEFVWNLQYRSNDIRGLIQRTGAQDAEITVRLLTAIERHIEALNSYSVFQLVGVLADHLTPADAMAVLELHVSTLVGALEPEDRIVPGFDTVGDLHEATGRYLFAQLSHIAHAPRWRAAHALRSLARLGQTDMLRQVWARYDIEVEPAFGHPAAPFYFLAGRVWFMLAVARIAWETSDAIAPYATWLLAQGESTKFPHLLVREASKSAMRGLAAAAPGDFDRALLDRIAAINVSPLPREASTEKSWSRGVDRHRPLSDEGRRFRFDSVDTLPYWYSGLIRCFARNDTAGFLDCAEMWIVDRLGVSRDPWEYDKLRGNARFNRGGYDRSSNGHGALPAIERYRTYLEWHAMFLTGGELLAKSPLAADEEPGSWEDFSSWIEREGPTLAPIWLADLRGPKPPEPAVWWAPSEANWLQTPSQEEVQHLLGIDDPDWVVISGHQTLRWTGLSSSARSESVLVSRSTATALRLALEASENSYQYRLAVDHEDQHEAVNPNFERRSLLADHHSDSGLDEHDPLRGDVNAPSQVPHARIVRSLGLRRDASRMPIWYDSRGKIAIMTRAWSDPRRPEEDGRSFVHGDALLIRRPILKSLLEHEDLDLAINLTITRRIGERDYAQDKNPEREREFDSIILLRHDGSIEASAGDLGRWA